jgi:hypothetical protein
MQAQMEEHHLQVERQEDHYHPPHLQAAEIHYMCLHLLQEWKHLRFKL